MVSPHQNQQQTPLPLSTSNYSTIPLYDGAQCHLSNLFHHSSSLSISFGTVYIQSTTFQPPLHPQSPDLPIPLRLLSPPPPPLPNSLPLLGMHKHLPDGILINTTEQIKIPRFAITVALRLNAFDADVVGGFGSVAGLEPIFADLGEDVDYFFFVALCFKEGVWSMCMVRGCMCVVILE